MRTLKTEFLFEYLTKALTPLAILDVGSMDGENILRLKQVSPESACFAFEANPSNFARMHANQRLIERQVRIFQNAVSDQNGQAEFHLSHVGKATGDWRQGTSSLLRRTDSASGVELATVSVQTVTLASFFKENNISDCALWIDVEGAAYQVLVGIGGAERVVRIGHVEVEDSPVWSAQFSAQQVMELLASMGYCCIARGRGKIQYDIVFVDKNLSKKMIVKVFLWLAFIASWVNKLLGKAVGLPLHRLILFFVPRTILR
jgi:FkbM family methyltransferase